MNTACSFISYRPKRHCRHFINPAGVSPYSGTAPELHLTVLQTTFSLVALPRPTVIAAYSFIFYSQPQATLSPLHHPRRGITLQRHSARVAFNGASNFLVACSFAAPICERRLEFHILQPQATLSPLHHPRRGITLQRRRARGAVNGASNYLATCRFCAPLCRCRLQFHICSPNTAASSPSSLT